MGIQRPRHHQVRLECKDLRQGWRAGRAGPWFPLLVLSCAVLLDSQPHLTIPPSRLTQGAVLSSQPSPPGVKEWVVLGQPGGLLGRNGDLAGVEPWGIQGEAAVVRGRALVRDSSGWNSEMGMGGTEMGLGEL